MGELAGRQVMVLEYAGDFLWFPIVLRRKRKASQFESISKLLFEVFLPAANIEIVRKLEHHDPCRIGKGDLFISG